MNTLSCFIIDDESSAVVLSSFIRETTKLNLFGVVSDVGSAMNSLLSLSANDILFFNIDLAKDYGHIHDYVLLNQTLVIVTSRVKDNAFQAFEDGFFDYLLKPFSWERFLKTINRVIQVRKSAGVRNSLYVQSGNKGNIIKILFDEIKYIEANQNFVMINTILGEHITYQTMKVIEQKLSFHFIRVHKSYIVNECKIHSVKNDCVYLYDKTIIKIGPKYRDKFLSKLMIGAGFLICLFLRQSNIGF
ncbi:LytR/AlgR family response regulator transcription factor [Pedobacter hiemivivus]|uniref:Response regulator transcription factor n=1 Tax=Pedobacter hiemivivus TaxID=2530454 RepID=A0A4R0NG01_9SPHI|nr:LytTR family DNA-binding domain-containing protein [Pedobacter hiemivivus]TCC99449.1 response regulator transcription factor [Pedobacter hiemivivus]